MNVLKERGANKQKSHISSKKKTMKYNQKLQTATD